MKDSEQIHLRSLAINRVLNRMQGQIYFWRGLTGLGLLTIVRLIFQ